MLKRSYFHFSSVSKYHINVTLLHSSHLTFKKFLSCLQFSADKNASNIVTNISKSGEKIKWVYHTIFNVIYVSILRAMILYIVCKTASDNPIVIILSKKLLLVLEIENCTSK